ncbi:hypothetical protein M8C21_003557 [Ambrosia artemisiifolia]|uniref:Uncharacterized protein n=1 Tax=Ambrosia artemisiifolia TaxID=4212 RepID=A0AAD5CML8_AMBAR|nr:hypothetical protein M8C21_003557 [Ambrosia artemisiifolia]
MSIQTILQDLKTIKKIINHPITTLTHHRKITDVIISATQTTTTIFSTLTPNTVNLILTDPNINTHKTLSLFNIILKNQSLLPFKIHIEHYATVICRLIQSRSFLEANNLLDSLANHQNLRYYVSVPANQCFHSRNVSKMFNLMLKVYSDTRKFDAGLETFDYMRDNGIEISERMCLVYLIGLMRSQEFGLCLGFLCKMMDSGVVNVSVYTLTVVVDGLCKNGEIKSARELVERGMCRGVGPNVVTFNTLVDACCRRWDFEELDLVLVLMKKGGVEFNLDTYRFLIDGFLSGGKVEDAERVIVEMCDKDLSVEIHLWNAIVRKYCKLGKMESAFKVFDKMIERGASANVETYRILVSGICGIGEMEAAKQLAEKLQRKDIDLGRDVFDELVNGCCKKGEFDDVVGLLSTMEKKGLFGDVRLYNMVIAGLCESHRVEEATRLLSFVVKCGANPDINTQTVALKSVGLNGPSLPKHEMLCERLLTLKCPGDTSRFSLMTLWLSPWWLVFIGEARLRFWSMVRYLFMHMLFGIISKILIAIHLKVIIALFIASIHRLLLLQLKLDSQLSVSHQRLQNAQAMLSQRTHHHSKEPSNSLKNLVFESVETFLLNSWNQPRTDF